MLGRLFRRDPREDAARALYATIVAQARRPEFYAGCAVPDSLDGRFDLVLLHVFLVLRRLKAGPAEARELGQRLFDTLFVDMDGSLREMGVGDLVIGKRVKAMVQAFYGRVEAYERALDGDEATLRAALGRNLYGTATPPEAPLASLAGYVRREAADLARQETAQLLAGDLRFGAPPGGG